MKYDYKRNIVALYNYWLFDFTYDGETEEEAIERAKRTVKELYVDVVEYYSRPDVKTDIDYLIKKAEEYKHILEGGFRVMTHKEFWTAKNEHLATEVKPSEITKAEYEDAFDQCDPVYFGADKDYEVFNLRTFAGVYYRQYVHDFKVDKYYTKLVKESDKSTGIVEMLKRKGQEQEK